MKLLGSSYLLQKKVKLNVHDQSSQQRGIILKLVQGDDWGVADLCPHPELGDASVQEEIKNKGLLFLRSMELAIEDMLARKNKVSLLQNRPVRNNYLISDYKNTDLNQERYRHQTLKIKADTDIVNLSEKLNSIQNEVSLRLDFNSCLDVKSYSQFLQLLTPATLKKIQYVEDPTVMCEEWKEWNQKLRLAYDFQKQSYNSEYAHYHIIKPVRERIEASENIILTSAMDHPVGVAHGLRLAQQQSQNVTGFLTLDLYEETGFEKYFVQSGSDLNFSSEACAEFGIGMNSELAKLQWSEL